MRKKLADFQFYLYWVWMAAILTAGLEKAAHRGAVVVVIGAVMVVIGLLRVGVWLQNRWGDK